MCQTIRDQDCDLFLTTLCFRVDRIKMMAALVPDRPTHCFFLLCIQYMNFNKTCMWFRAVKKGRPRFNWLDIFTFSSDTAAVIIETQEEAGAQHPLPFLCSPGRFVNKDYCPGLWLSKWGIPWNHCMDFDWNFQGEVFNVFCQVPVTGAI